MIFICGLPAVGKSQLIDQIGLIAQEQERSIHLLHWNSAREPFERPPFVDRYPETDGVTHPVVRKAVGTWSRRAVQAWAEQHNAPHHLLIGEIPLIGNRLLELIMPQDDAAESILISDEALFLVPVPAWDLRNLIDARRSGPNEDEETEPEFSGENGPTRDRLGAPPNVLRDLWREINGIARHIGLTKARPDAEYNPYIYGGVYEALLKHRNSRMLLIEEIDPYYTSEESVERHYPELRPTAAEAARELEATDSRYSERYFERLTEDWHLPLTQALPPKDLGPILQLPLPAQLHQADLAIDLSPPQRTALLSILRQPVDAPAHVMLPLLDEAILRLRGGAQVEPTLADVKKFDIFDSYFNLQRTSGDEGLSFVSGLLQAYRQVIANLEDEHELTIIELPMLRIALETTLNLFI